jgi:hypothetical protein
MRDRARGAARLLSLLVTLAGALGAFAPGVAAAQSGPPGCVGETDAAQVPQRPGPLVRFGINARAVTGQIGPTPATAVPEDPARHLAKLGELRAPGAPFPLRLTRFFWRDGEAGFQEFLALTQHYTSHGYPVELQVRYQPNEAQEGDIAAWTAHVREVVRRFGPNPLVVGLQITNEVNITFSPDSSDGGHEGAREALVQGVIAAKDEARRLGYDQLRVGFNWAYRTDPPNETSFWQALRDRGGPQFVQSLDFIGLDVYPGTIFPPAESDIDGYRDAMVNAMSTIRCYASIPGIPESVPIEIGENGWPTFASRSYDDQARILRVMVQAVHDFRGTYNVRDYRWFNLRDSRTGDAGVFQNAGLLEDDYDEKPAFAAYRELVAKYTARGESAGGREGERRDAGGRPRLSLRLRYRAGRTKSGRRCARSRVRARVAGADRRQALRAGFWRDGRRVARDVRPPLGRVVDRGPRRAMDPGSRRAIDRGSRRAIGSGARRLRGTRHRATARVRMADGRLIRLKRRYLVCGSRAT